MNMKHKGQRVVVLMDVQNLYHSAKHLYQSRVDFKEILDKGVSDRTLIRSFAYVISTKSGEEQSFFEALTKLGIETRIKDLQEYSGGFKKGDWDVGMVIDAIRLSNSADSIVLATGDGDFVPLVNYLQNEGIRVEIIAFKRSTSSRLIEAADEFIDLEENSERFLLKK